MPRKTPRPAQREVKHGRGFNEAAARCRGKRVLRGDVPQVVEASMRPRPDAAENTVYAHHAQGGGPASMRPRPDAAENEEKMLLHVGVIKLQ